MTFEDFYCGFTADSHEAFSVSPTEGKMERRNGPPTQVKVTVKPSGRSGEHSPARVARKAGREGGREGRRCQKQIAKDRATQVKVTVKPPGRSGEHYLALAGQGFTQN
jgi:quercetin dioxygenase-like cupin family protein